MFNRDKTHGFRDVFSFYTDFRVVFFLLFFFITYFIMLFSEKKSLIFIPAILFHSKREKKKKRKKHGNIALFVRAAKIYEIYKNKNVNNFSMCYHIICRIH